MPNRLAVMYPEYDAAAKSQTEKCMDFESCLNSIVSKCLHGPQICSHRGNEREW